MLCVPPPLYTEFGWIQFIIMSQLFSRCGDRLLAVDGHTLENIPHHLAVAMLKQTSTRVVMEVVSWMGTEL